MSILCTYVSNYQKMETIRLVWRFAVVVVYSTVRKFEADFVLKSAKLWDGTDVTAGALANLAAGKPLPPGRLVVRYTYKSTGPYAYFAEGRGFPPPVDQIRIIPPDEQIVAAEADDFDDVTDELVAFAGPDGHFHGQGTDEDIISIFGGKYAKIELTFANGNTKIVQKII